ncbi:MAG: DinB family protein [Salaquimonas sp.]|nr:DinB family protein [Salaquimonas sp.]
MHSQFTMFANYNCWANDKLYEAAAILSEKEYNRNVGVFFHSMKGTLNHMLVADRIWMHRFTGEGEHPNQLDAILYEELRELAVARKSEDRRIVRYIEDLQANDLVANLNYTTITSPATMSQHLSSALSHFFNHQTHHRGQAHAVLSLLQRDPPPLDLLFFLRSEQGKQFS